MTMKWRVETRLVTTATEGTLDLLASLLESALHLIGSALGLQPPVAGGLAGVAQNPAAQLLSLALKFVRNAHNGLLIVVEGGPGPALGTPPTRQKGYPYCNRAGGGASTAVE